MSYKNAFPIANNYNDIELFCSDANFQDYYSDMARTTALYPKELGVNYCIEGLVSETAETYEKIKYYERMEVEEKNILIKDEIGDIFLYISNTVYEINYDIKTLFENVLNNMNDFVTRSKRHPRHNDFDSLLIISGSMVGITKKILRDDNCKLTDEKRVKLIDLLNRFTYKLVKYCYTKKYDLFEICNNNLNKLKDRMERGVIQGSGDNR